MVDGASRFGAFRRVTLPLVAPGLVATGVFAFIQAWNEFIFALVIMQRPGSKTLPVWLQEFNEGARGTDWGGVMAGSTLMAIPVIVFFLHRPAQGDGGSHGRGGEGVTVVGHVTGAVPANVAWRRSASTSVRPAPASRRSTHRTDCRHARRSPRRAGRRRWWTPSPGSSTSARRFASRRSRDRGVVVAVGHPRPRRRRRRLGAKRAQPRHRRPTPFGDDLASRHRLAGARRERRQRRRARRRRRSRRDTSVEPRLPQHRHRAGGRPRARRPDPPRLDRHGRRGRSRPCPRPRPAVLMRPARVRRDCSARAGRSPSAGARPAPAALWDAADGRRSGGGRRARRSRRCDLLDDSARRADARRRRRRARWRGRRARCLLLDASSCDAGSRSRREASPLLADARPRGPRPTGTRR